MDVQNDSSTEPLTYNVREIDEDGLELHAKIQKECVRLFVLKFFLATKPQFGKGCGGNRIKRLCIAAASGLWKNEVAEERD